jgi:hypothetical protein
MEGGSNTSTVALRVVGGDKREVSIWDSKIWSRVPRDSDPRTNVRARPAAIVNERSILSSEKILYKKYDAGVVQLRKKFWPWV